LQRRGARKVSKRRIPTGTHQCQCHFPDFLGHGDHHSTLQSLKNFEQILAEVDAAGVAGDLSEERAMREKA
jgi:hypothetical protein